MLIGGLQKTTLIDFPGRVACTVFTVGCNFRCGFCHNPELVLTEKFKKRDWIEEAEIWKFLEKRKKVLDGMCITGGEPTMQVDLEDWIEKVVKIGLEIKLDTNGSNFKVVERLMKKELVSRWAIDFKAEWKSYGEVVGKEIDVDQVRKSIELMMREGKEWEIRTTIVPGVHDEKRLKKMKEQLGELEEKTGKEIEWVWQRFLPGKCLDKEFDKKEAMEWLEVEEMKRKVEEKGSGRVKIVLKGREV